MDALFVSGTEKKCLHYDFFLEFWSYMELVQAFGGKLNQLLNFSFMRDLTIELTLSRVWFFYECIAH